MGMILGPWRHTDVPNFRSKYPPPPPPRTPVGQDLHIQKVTSTKPTQRVKKLDVAKLTTMVEAQHKKFSETTLIMDLEDMDHDNTTSHLGWDDLRTRIFKASADILLVLLTNKGKDWFGSMRDAFC